MKAILFCLLNFFLCIFAQAQTYHSFMHDTAVWREWQSTPCCDPQFGAYQMYFVNFIMMGDTTFNSYTYKRIYSQQIGCDYGGGCLPCPDNIYAPELHGFIREDSSKKVFFLRDQLSFLPVQCSQESFDTEKILYDFGLSVGDTVLWKPFNNVVIGIDSVPAPTGEYLRRIKFDNQQDFWVEGLGSSFAFFGSYMPPPFECGCELYCAQASDLLPENALPPCGGIVTAVKDLQIDEELTISPNPFSDFISLASPFQSSSLLSVINSRGQLILKKKLLPLEKFSFTKNEYSMDNIIFFRLISDEGILLSALAIQVN